MGVSRQSYFTEYSHRRRIRIRPELSATCFNGNSFAQFGTNANSSPVWMGLHSTWNNQQESSICHDLLFSENRTVCEVDATTATGGARQAEARAAFSAGADVAHHFLQHSLAGRVRNTRGVVGRREGGVQSQSCARAWL